MKPIDPATRLSDLLAQSLEELTRPFDGPGTGKAPPAAFTATEKPPAPKLPDAPPAPAAKPPEPAPAAVTFEPAADGVVPTEPQTSRSLDLEAEKALAELEAELFAATRKAGEAGRPAEGAKPEDGDPAPVDAAAGVDQDGAARPVETEAAATPPEAEPAPPPADAAAAQLIARVRRLMVATILFTLLAVGGLFAFIGYRIYKSDEAIDKKVDKIPLQVPAPPPEVTLSLPANARIIQAGVADERLVVTLEVDGKIEVRVFDVKTLQPAARMGFSTTP